MSLANSLGNIMKELNASLTKRTLLASSDVILHDGGEAKGSKMSNRL
jgi:hypothetical protein